MLNGPRLNVVDAMDLCCLRDLMMIYRSDNPSNNVIALKDNCQSTRLRANTTRLSSLAGKDVTKFFLNIYSTTMKHLTNMQLELQ